ncbi:actin [Porphyridium purpureum]|uniref:Actin n=1 Tax=Porphyridium purpureum TaxID=35688 RepID=A0A5J4YIB0_PORPP|nr:actin [Porphyridium purpureum]|eukprot:POR6890..scf261_15
MSKSIAVLDPGSTRFKCGLSGEAVPKATFASVIAMRADADATNASAAGLKKVNKDMHKAEFVGEEVLTQKQALNPVHYPIQRGEVKDWEHMELLYYQALHNELKIDPSQHAVFVVGSPLSTTRDREHIAQIMFESFAVPRLRILDHAACCIVAAGKASGMVIEMGGSGTTVSPVYEGVTMRLNVQRANVGGADISAYIAKQLAQANPGGSKYDTPAQMERVKEIKHSVCQVSETVLSKIDPALATEYVLPDGQRVKVPASAVVGAEGYFNPALIGATERPLNHLVHGSLAVCSDAVRTMLLQNVVLSGGSSLFPGMIKRIENEVNSVMKPKHIVKAIAPPEREYTAWLGGATLAALGTFPQVCVSMADYNEFGPGIVRRHW